MERRAFFRWFFLFLALLSPAAVAAADIKVSEPETIEPEPNTVILQGLNKVTGRISRLDGPVGTILHFGKLEIIPRRCWKSPPEEMPENAVLLEIREIKQGEEPKRIFLGWMFGSSPGLSGLEHPVYDINVRACEYHADPER